MKNDMKFGKEMGDMLVVKTLRERAVNKYEQDTLYALWF